MLILPLIILITCTAVWLFVRHQRKLKTRAYLMQEALRNRDFTFRLSPRGLFFGEKAMQEALNNLGLELKRQMALQEVESWRKLTRVLTHEIMNATAPIASISQAFLTRPDVQGAPIEEGIHAIHDTALGLSSFVENYRKLTQLQRPQPTTFPLRTLIEQIAPTYPTLDWQTDIPDNTTVTTDESLLRQVLTNLAKNAQEAGARRIELSVRNNRIPLRLRLPEKPQKADVALALTVSNDGLPIPAELRREIFTPFFTTKPKGSGIGLSLSRQIMVMLGGDLQLADTPSPSYHATFILSFL